MARVRFDFLLDVIRKLGEDNKEENINAPEYAESSFLSDLKKQTADYIKHEEKETNGKKGSKVGGLKKKYETPTIDVEEMSQEKLEEMRKKLEDSREERE